jgi:hypothetical protein
MNSTVVKSIDFDSSENHITAVFITAFIVYMSVVALVFVCCCCKPCLRGIFLCIYDRAIFSSKKKVVKIISNDSPNRIVDLSAVIVQVE